jgi:hypothetical protein
MDTDTDTDTITNGIVNKPPTTTEDGVESGMTDDMIQLGKINYSNILTGCLINVENLFKNTVQPYMVSTNILTALPQVLRTPRNSTTSGSNASNLTTIQDGFIQRFYPPTIYFTARRPSSSLRQG